MAESHNNGNRENTDTIKSFNECTEGITVGNVALQKGFILNKRYEIEGIIKAGGMGAVYKAIDHKFEKIPCAVKEMLCYNPERKEHMIKLFLKEAQILHTLRHPQLPVVKDYFIENDRYYLVMDYIEGRDLETVMEEYGEGSVTEELVIKWSKEVLDILDYLHNQSPPIVYRDLKPGNIMLRNSDDKIILIDFGIARTVSITSTVSVCGTAGFAPIEVYEGKPETRSDIYSLGATMYYLLSKEIPVINQIEPLNDVNPKVTEELSSIIIRALSVKAADRYGSAGEMKKALEELSGRELQKTLIIEASPKRKSNLLLKIFIPLLLLFAASLIALRLFNPVLFYSIFPFIPGGSNVMSEWNFNRGLTYYGQGKYEEAINCYDRVLKINPEYEKALYEKARVLEKQKKYEEAIKCFVMALKINPHNTSAREDGNRLSDNLDWYKKGMELNSRKQYKEAIEYFNKTLEINPFHINSLMAEEWSFENLNKYEDAISCLDKILNIDPEYIEALNAKGIILCKEGKYEEAIKYYDKALEINPEYAFTWFNKGLVYYNQYKYEDALKCFDKALEFYPEDIPAWHYKGLCLFEQGKDEEAIKFFDKALELDPENKYIWDDRGRALSNQFKYEEAIKCFDKALMIDPEYRNAWIDRGWALYSLNRYEEAIKYYDKALEVNSKDTVTWNARGMSLYALNRYEEAIKCYDKSLEINPEDIIALNGRGVNLYNLNRYEEAIKCYDRALKINPNYEPAKINKKEVLKKMKR